MKQIILLIICLFPFFAIAQNMKDLSGDELIKNADYKELRAAVKPYEEKLDALIKEYTNASPAQKNNDEYIQSIEERYDAILKEMNDVFRSFISQHPDSYISLVALLRLFKEGLTAEEGSVLFEKLSLEVKNTILGKSLISEIFSHKKTAIGSTAPDFVQKDPNGKSIKLSDFRGKYVLIDFWASWCGPCRAENPAVVAVYNKFKDKNFEILGVSLDNSGSKNAWLNAIKQDNLNWPQVSDLKGWKNEAAVLYDVQTIPQNFLLNPEGIIIDKNLRGEELNRVLSTIFK